MKKYRGQETAALLAALCSRAGALPPGRDRSQLLLLALILSHTTGERTLH